MAAVSALLLLDSKGKPVLSRDYRCVRRGGMSEGRGCVSWQDMREVLC